MPNAAALDRPARRFRTRLRAALVALGAWVVTGPLGCASAPAPLPLRGLEREVSFPTTDRTLQGTVTLPEGDGPFPAVVLVHGSGPNSRDEELPGQLNMSFGFRVATFRDLAYGLAERGIATLRYDKRTCGPFNDCADNGYEAPPPSTTPRHFVDDALAAVRAVRKQPGIDPQRVFVVGHSQGAALTPVVVEADAQLAGGALLAGNHSPLDEIIAGQRSSSKEMLDTLGVPELVAAPQLKPLEQTVAALAELRAGTFAGDDIGGAPVAFWKTMFELEEEKIAAARTTARPLLVLGGGYDWNVPSTEFAAWEEELGDKTQGPVELVELACVTHALNCVSQPDFQKIAPGDIGKHVDSRVVETLARWVLADQAAAPAGTGATDR